MIEQYINTVHCMDSLEFMRKLPDKCIDLVLTDPPYEFIYKNPTGGGFMEKGNKTHLENIGNIIGFNFEPLPFLEEIKRISKKMNAYIFTNKSLLKNYIDFAEKNNYKWEILLWLKSNPVPIQNGHYLIDKEYIFFIKEPGSVFNSTKGYDKYFTYQSVSIGSNNKNGHPTEKPIQLLLNKIEISSNPGDIVLDCFAGSGTTGVACIETGRKYILIEKEPVYVDIINKRIKNTTPPLFVM